MAFKNTDLLKTKVISLQLLSRNITGNLSFLVYLCLFRKQNLGTKDCNRLFRNESHQMLGIKKGTKPPSTDTLDNENKLSQEKD